MSRVNEIQHDISLKGKSVLGCLADIFDATNQKKLALAGNLSNIAVTQFRAPVEAANFSEYCSTTTETFADTARAYNTYGRDIVAAFRGIPQQIKDSLNTPAKKSDN